MHGVLVLALLALAFYTWRGMQCRGLIQLHPLASYAAVFSIAPPLSFVGRDREWGSDTKDRHTRGDMHCLHEGTCSGDKFLEVFTRRNLSQGLAKWPFLIGLFWYCRGDMLHEQFTRGDNRIFCCFVAATCPLNSNWFIDDLVLTTRRHSEFSNRTDRDFFNHRHLADTKPTLPRQSGDRWATVGRHHL